jgi:hypothetical protein
MTQEQKDELEELGKKFKNGEITIKEFEEGSLRVKGFYDNRGNQEGN